jgi:hypothetical protein
LFDCSSISSNKTSSSDKKSLCFLNSAPFKILISHSLQS